MYKNWRLKRLLDVGYFPAELPPPFHTHDFARFRNKIGTAWEPITRMRDPNKIQVPRTSCAIFNTPRRGHARRLVKAPNPIAYLFLCKSIVENWGGLKKLISVSKLTVSGAEILKKGNRSVSMPKFTELPEHRVKSYAGRKFILQTDLSRFYHSIYTHSVPWAIHTKPIAKKKDQRSAKYYGNDIDYYLRQCQDGQTMGIPVGPDVSRIISECIVATIDMELQKTFIGMTGLRYVDDYFLCFDSFDEAERALTKLSTVAREFELEINATKTKISETETFNEDVWPYRLDKMPISLGSGQRRSIVAYFTQAIELSKKFSDESIAKYAVKRSATKRVDPDNWDVYEAFLIRVAQENSNTLDLVVKIICAYASINYQVSDKVTQFANFLILQNGPLNNHYEVAWSLWLLRSLNRKVSRAGVDILKQLDNPFCILLALDLASRGLLEKSLNVSIWERKMDTKSLTSKDWLLYYEASVKHWMSRRVRAAVNSDNYFSVLSASNVSFYGLDAKNKPVRIPGYEMEVRRLRMSSQNFPWEDLDRRSSEFDPILNGNIHLPENGGRFGRWSDDDYEDLGSGYGDVDLEPNSELDYDIHVDDLFEDDGDTEF